MASRGRPIVRLFIAINFPPPLRATVHGATQILRLAAPAARWVDADRIHLTMKFLGEQPETAVAPLFDALARVGRGFDPIEFQLADLGAFPNLRRPRVVWLGVKADPKLELLHHDVERACAGLGYEIEGRAFRPHVTLARIVDRGIDARALATAARSVEFRETTVAESIDLMVSEHAGGRPRYRVVGSALLSRH